LAKRSEAGLKAMQIELGRVFNLHRPLVFTAEILTKI
jgi:hypothetical protein